VVPMSSESGTLSLYKYGSNIELTVAMIMSEFVTFSTEE
jgi:hypothetical protein